MLLINEVINSLIESPNLHVRSSAYYELLKKIVRDDVVKSFSSESRKLIPFGIFGELSFPYKSMGAIDSLDLFGLDELIIFAFYHKNRLLYKNCLDIGCNLGLHSLIMSRCGFEVRAFEPDPIHFELASENLICNNAANVNIFQEAISNHDGVAQFVRVLGNTTGSHLLGSKDSYGDKDQFQVKIRDVTPLLKWADLAKIDAEGHEKEILAVANAEIMQNLDIMVEIGNIENAKFVYNHFASIGINMFSQKLGWNKVKNIEDIPTSHREGSLFISNKNCMPW
jgi:FkbM family methyltransferase